MGNLKSKLAGLKSKWNAAKKKAQEEGAGFTEFDDGRYTAKLAEARVEESQSSGRLQAVFGWKFQEGEYEGKVKYAYQGLETEDGMYYFGRDLARLGYELPDDITEIEAILADAVKSNILATIVLKTKGDFQNAYIRKVFTDEEEEEVEEEVDEEAEAAEETEEEAEEEGEEEAEEEEAEEEEAEEEEAEEEEAEEEEGVEIEVGMRVQVETAKGREAGKIVEVLADEGKVRVKLDTNKVLRVDVDKIEVELEAEEAPEDPAKPAKKEKAAPAPAKKTPPPPAKKAAPPAKKKR